jgi:hypothetical protein
MNDRTSVISPAVLMTHRSARRRRPDRTDRRLGAALGKAPEKGTLKVYEKFAHGMCTTHADVVTPELLAFIAG